MIPTIYLKINDEILDIDDNTTEVFKLNKFIIRTDDFSIGGEYSSNFTIPVTNKNLRILELSRNHQAIKFKKGKIYKVTIEANSTIIFTGNITIERIRVDRIELFINSDSSSWVGKLKSLKLNEMNWKGSEKSGIIYRGAESFNDINKLDYNNTDFYLPTVLRVKPFNFRYNPFDWQLDSSLEIPNGYNDSDRVNLPDDYPYTSYLDSHSWTHEDFPPAILYSNLLDKIFDTAGISYENPLRSYEWFRRLVMTYSGSSYQYNTKALHTLNMRGYNIASNDNYFDLPTTNDLVNLYTYNPYMIVLLAPPTIITPALYTNDIPNYGIGSRLNNLLIYKLDNAQTPNDLGISAIVPLTVPKYTDLKQDSLANYNSNASPIYTINTRPSIVPNQYYSNQANISTASYNAFWRVPADGIYKFKFKLTSNEFDPLDPNERTLNTKGLFTSLSDGLNDYRFGRQPFIIYKARNAKGAIETDILSGEVDDTSDYAIISNQFAMRYFYNEVVNNTDILFYFNAYEKFKEGLPEANPRVSYCPINKTYPTIIDSGFEHVYFTSPSPLYRQNSFVEAEFEAELLEGEEIYFGRHVRLSAIGGSNSSYLFTISYNTSLEIEMLIEPTCGETDLNLAINLPNISASEFLSDFCKRFNLNYIYDNDKVTFINNNINSKSNIINIDKYCDWNTRTYSVLDTYDKVKVGYEIDLNDFNLTRYNESCDKNRMATDYGVYNIINEELNNYTIVGKLFSSTVFSNYLRLGGSINVKNYINGNIINQLQTLQPSLYFRDAKYILNDIIRESEPNGVIYTKLNIIGWNKIYNITTEDTQINPTIDFDALRMVYTAKFPILYNETNQNALKLKDSEYSWEQKMRLLIYLGTSKVVNNSSGLEYDFQILLENPDVFNRLSYKPIYSNSNSLGAGYYIRPAFTSFDLEYPSTPSHNMPELYKPTQTLKYDGIGGLYDLLFGDSYIQNNPEYNYKEVMQIDAFLPFTIYKKLNAQSIISIQGIQYKLLEISDFDLTSKSLCKLKLLKL